MISAAARQEVELGEVLEHANRVIRAQHGDGARQPDPLRARRGCRQRDDGRRHDEVRAMVLTDAEHIEPDLLGQVDLLEELAHPASCVRRAAAPGGQLGEGVEADLHRPGL
jgi:hypothetical protein